MIAGLAAELDRVARRLTTADTAKLIRSALKTAFSHKYPTTKFTVHSKTYSGGSSIDVAWVDGPSVAAVEAITGHYQGADFDGMTDCKTSRHPVLLNSEWVKMGADFVFVSRRLSDRYSDAIARAIGRAWQVVVPESRAQWFGVNVPGVDGPHGVELETLVYRVSVNPERYLQPCRCGAAFESGPVEWLCAGCDGVINAKGGA